ncbi:MAG: hypothetical protein R3Y19_07705 [Rikenellaceae bacterium]
MKKIILILAVFMSVMTINAQEAQHKTIVVDYFKRPANIKAKYTEMIRAVVLTTFTNSGRFKVIDAANETSLALSAEIAESGEIPTLDNIRQESMKKAGGNFLISGNVVNIAADKGKTSDGKIYYSGVVNVSLNVVDLETGQSIAARELKYSGVNAKTGDTPDLAVAATIDYVSLSMNKFINDFFKLKTEIIQVQEVKGGKALTVYINIGSTLGIEKGQTFKVYQIKEIAGKKSRTEVGTLVASDVQGEDLTLCKVSGKGCGELVLEASTNPEAVVLEIETGKKRVGFGESLKTVL